jgi:site-specific DNA-methyltransferase (adenine-specific)
MELYSSNDSYKLYKGDMRNMLDVIKKESIDAVLTDPPYELNFMSKNWDNSGIAFQPSTWTKCYEVLKPGGYLLAFGGSRTFHRIACAIEDAGFEIRDTIMWLYGSGFPKSMAIDKSIEGKLTTGSGNTRDFHKLNGEVEEKGNYGYATMKFQQGDRPRDYNYESESSKRLAKLEPTTALAQKYKGWGTALKPSFEPIIVARKPFKGSLVDNVIEYGVGGINIDECRVETKPRKTGTKPTSNEATGTGNTLMGSSKNRQAEYDKLDLGRFPANTILTYDETDFDEVCGGFPNTKSNYEKPNTKHTFKGNKDAFTYGYKMRYGSGYEDSGSASRYFYCAKASKKDRDEGLDEFEEVDTTELLNRKANTAGILWEQGGTNAFSGAGGIKKNTHPTVKPTELMQYLVRLVSPNGATILDPFNGSGSTGKAVMYENRERNKNYKYIGIELTEEYLPISKARIEYVCNLPEEKDPQMTIFDFIGEE